MISVILITFAITLIFLLVGIITKKHHSKFPDVSVGYHLFRAEKSEAVWEEANKYAGEYCIRSSLIVLILNFAVLFCYIGLHSRLSASVWAKLIFSYLFGALGIQLILLFVLPIRHLNKKFGKE